MQPTGKWDRRVRLRDILSFVISKNADPLEGGGGGYGSKMS